MRMLFLCGNYSKDFSVSVCQALEKFGGALLIEKDAVTQKYLYEPEYIVCQYEYVPRLSVAKAIVIESSPQEELIFSLIKDCRIEAKFKVGFNNTDDITVSSISNSNICISILSAVKTMSGNEILPCEIKIRNLSDYDIYAVLAAVTVLLLTDKTGNEFSIEI